MTRDILQLFITAFENEYSLVIANAPHPHNHIIVRIEPFEGGRYEGNISLNENDQLLFDWINHIQREINHARRYGKPLPR